MRVGSALWCWRWSRAILFIYRSLTFQSTPAEQKFLSPRWLDGTRKNISLERGGMQGATGTAEELRELSAMIERFAVQAEQFVRLLFPRYAADMYLARTSFRPAAVENRAISWRKDDARLHVDAFPSRPNYGERILRVFSNVNPHGEPRVWRAGEPFKNAAQRFLPSIKRPLPGSATLLTALGITKNRRSEYDHIMLHLHDALKADMDYQRTAPQQELALAAGSTWNMFYRSGLARGDGWPILTRTNAAFTGSCAVPSRIIAAAYARTIARASIDLILGQHLTLIELICFYLNRLFI